MNESNSNNEQENNQKEEAESIDDEQTELDQEETDNMEISEDEGEEQDGIGSEEQFSKETNEIQPLGEDSEPMEAEDQQSPEENAEVAQNEQTTEEEIEQELEEEISEEKSEEQQLREFHKNQVEAALYASGRALSVEEISLKLDIGKEEVEELINELAFDYLDRSTALIIAQTGEKYQMQIKHEYTDSISDFAEGGAIKEKYLRTLTVIALKQPILKSLLVKLRGTGAYQHVKYLEKQGLIDSVKKGRTSELTTTDKYAEMFGLPKDISRMKETLIAQLGVEEEDK
ncbi:MAG: SMC-Scp complex subunit ScpB [Promethearchaeia archaeon]